MKHSGMAVSHALVVVRGGTAAATAVVPVVSATRPVK
jgi:hypothetical protein